MNQKIYKCLALAALALFFTAEKIHAQQNDYLHCGIEDAMTELFNKHPELAAEHQALQQQAQQEAQNYRLSHHLSPADTNAPMFIVPTVFHIIHQYGTEDISDAQVQDEINILNRDYRCNNSDTSTVINPFKSVYADTKIEFRLATIDPQGNCTNGIDRVYSH